MSDKTEFDFEVMPTGVPNMDIVLGGGIPVGSFNLVAGGPGTGKTIFSQQMMFHNATVDRPALHFTVLGEPVAKLLRYQSRFSFFDPQKVSRAIRYVDIGDVIRKEGLERGLEVIVTRVERYNPSIVVVDSVRAVRELARREAEYGLRTFSLDLAQVAVVWNATSFMLGEYEENELRAGPEFTLADGIIWMSLATAENSAVRKLQVVKSRGMDIVQGLHSFRITRDGVHVFPRIVHVQLTPEPKQEGRTAFGVPGLDRMLNGGIPRGEACLLGGTSGVGKTILAQHFLVEGIARGEPSVAAIFEETPGEYMSKASNFGWDFAQAERDGKLALVYGKPIDLTIDEVIDEVRNAVERLGAKRLVIDSITGLDLARAPADRSDFRETILRLVSEFRSRGVTIVMTSEVPEVFGEIKFSAQEISPVADNIVMARFIEIESELRSVISVIKMRSSEHDRQLRQFYVTARGVNVGAPFRGFTGLLSGVPTMVAVLGPQPFAPGLEPRESTLVQALFALGVAGPEQLVAATGYSSDEVQRMLDTLVGQGYVVQEKVDDQTKYHVAMMSWAPSIRRITPEGSQQGGGSARGTE